MRLTRRTGGTAPLSVAVVFLFSGVSSLIFSVFYTSQISAFIGLGLTLWGVLFLFLRPGKCIDSSLVESTVASGYSTIDRIIKDFKYQGKGYYIPPYPKDAHLPEHLKGLKDMVVFLSAENDAGTPSIEEMVEGRFLLVKSKGALVTPPGIGLLSQIEKLSRVDFTTMSLGELCEFLPRFFVEDFNLAKEMEMGLVENQANLKLSGSLYRSLYGAENSFSSVSFLGCPIASAVACALAKSSGKVVAIQKQVLSPDGLTVEVWYRFL